MSNKVLKPRYKEIFYQGYSANRYDKSLIEYDDKLSKIINV